VYQGETVVGQVNVEPYSVSTSQVRLYVESAPAGVSVSLQPDTGTPPFSATVILSASQNIAPGKYSVTIGSISKDGNESVTYDLTVEQASTATPTSHSVTIVVHDIYGMPVSGALVTLSLAGWSPSLMTGSSGTVVFLQVPASAFNVTVTYMGASTLLSGNSLENPQLEVTVVLSPPVALTVGLLVVGASAVFLFRRLRHKSLTLRF
jgi:hypothetical protein